MDDQSDSTDSDQDKPANPFSSRFREPPGDAEGTGTGQVAKSLAETQPLLRDHAADSVSEVKLETTDAQKIKIETGIETAAEQCQPQLVPTEPSNKPHRPEIVIEVADPPVASSSRSEIVIEVPEEPALKARGNIEAPKATYHCKEVSLDELPLIQSLSTRSRTRTRSTLRSGVTSSSESQRDQGPGQQRHWHQYTIQIERSYRRPPAFQVFYRKVLVVIGLGFGAGLVGAIVVYTTQPKGEEEV
ncbi:hypothetical protein BJY04DRAFT_224367 [Aspergillus karnatakaensis]|uniref:uncharacterized protein n=1 Tax=Aspergillus karnatakaensis TaxID=1810916 RepID=UPI003CCDCA42